MLEIKSYKEILNPKKPYWLFLSFFVCASVLITIEATSKDTLGQPKIPDEKIDVTTFIPMGYVLIPLEISNLEKLNSLIQATATVDLYASVEQESTKRKLIARNIKILRAPLNPEEFAALVPENSELAEKLTQAIYVVIKNKDSKMSLPTKAFKQIPTILGDQL